MHDGIEKEGEEVAMKTTKKAVKWMVIALIMMILGCTFAWAINTNMGAVNVSEIQFETERGTMSAYLYMPEGAGADNPRPVVVLAHGYLNNKEMQDAGAVELSRRGYIVMVVDQYDHGLSRWEADIPNGSEMATFWIYSMSDAVNYAYNQDFTLKDEAGNAYIGCSGHSMGGLSTVLAVFFDEMQALQTGHRMIYTAIPVSADFSFTENVAPLEAILAAYGSRTIGIVQGRYDEFFFGASEGMYYKDFINASEAGAKFLGLAEGERGEAETFYEVESGDVMMEDGTVVRPSETGKHIVYQLNEAHAQNHFSINAERFVIDFFQEAFEGVTTPDMTLANLTSDNQVWWLKELGNFIALIGFFIFVVPFISLITKVGFLKNAVTEETEVIPQPTGSVKRTIFVIASVVVSLLPGLLFVPLMDKVPTGIANLRNVMIAVAVIMLVVGLIFYMRAKKSASEKDASYARGGFVSAVVSLAMVVVLCLYRLFNQSPYFNSTSTNWSVYWAFVLAFICLLMVVMTYYFINKPNGVKLEAYGIKVKPRAVGAAFLTAVITFVVGYLLVFVIDGILNVDFRIWTLAVKVFAAEHFVTMLKYVPFYFAFYLVMSVLVNANTRRMKHSCLAAILSTTGGCILFMIVQYGMFYITGRAMWAGSGMVSIGMLAIIPCLIVASIYTRKIYDATNNVWTAGFFNALLFTMMNVANAILHWNLV